MILGPDTKATLKLATLVSAICFTVSATIFLWTIKENGEKALAEIKELRQDWKGEFTPYAHKVDRLWWDHEQRSSISQTITTPKVGMP